MTHAPGPDPDAGSAEPQQLGIRLVTVHDDRNRRVDLQLVGSRGVAVEDGLATTFEAARLWPTVRGLLPALDQLVADPAGRPSPDPDRVPEPGWDERCRAMVSLAVVALGAGTADAAVVVRTWFATEDGELWSATPMPVGTTDIRLAAPGAVADLLIWDVTGALETLVVEPAS